MCGFGRVPSVNVVFRRILAKKDVWRNLSLKESFLRQKSRVSWLKEGDCNSRFFHNAMRGGEEKTYLFCQYKRRDIEAVFDIKEEVRRYFEVNFLEISLARPVIYDIELKPFSLEDSLVWELPFTNLEIKEAVWRCCGDKSPGSNGFYFCFFQSCWKVIKVDVVCFVTNFRYNAKLTKAATTTFLALIPKCNNPQELNNYRSI